MTYDVHVQALEECGRQARRVRNMLDLDDAFVDSGVKAPQGDTKADIFGELDGAAGLAAKIDAVWKSVGDEFGEGRNRLENVERALSQVATNFRNAETGSGA
ncbi:hypothetical protein MF672_046970 [Actinomadura sp. ATCC 31491]|uniref:PE domain-containing protein n=1 Tax=Actinomadura luzonensis TaxID=2805427 RepID=A0ABT0GA70_9ACTN|nr:hypothetical protein [Actinomadura luzonensis]MCK2221298.1 hypothetical protein [Actinomadura luzonensis]